MSLEIIQKKKEVIESRARIREFVFGIQDGLVSTVGLLAGVQGATENNAVVIIAGLTSVFAGAISMATGTYLSAGAEKDIFDKELREAEELAKKEPYLVAEGLLKALGEEGLKKEQSYRIVKLLYQEERVLLRTFQEIAGPPVADDYTGVVDVECLAHYPVAHAEVDDLAVVP